ncbi:MAG: hypothetical protein HF973_12975 [Chloroflexi bacterium]|nr:hypothetical protein [Chloroflexota bacterium]
MRSKRILPLIFFAAFLPRLAAIGRYVTPDELIWVFRSVQFREALLQGEWLETLTAGHPGVMTTWLGALGLSLQLGLRPSDTAVYTWITQLAWFAPENISMLQNLSLFLTSGRLLVALVNSLGVVVIFLLARRLVGAAAALLLAFWLALDPFTIGLSGLLHVDGLLTTFSMISLLALANVWEIGDWGLEIRALTAASGITAAFALLSKSPALLLPGLAALFLFASLFFSDDRTVNWRTRWRNVLLKGAVWLLSYVGTLWLFLPALWVSPAQVAARLNEIAGRHIESALRPTYFMGETTFAPGPFYYPVTLAFRLSPLVFLGLILAIGLIIRQRGFPTAYLARLGNRGYGVLALFGLWIVLFLAGISLAAKKFDRYALPVVPPLLLLAALAWFGWPRFRSRRWLVGLIGLQAVFWLFYAAYPLTAVNPLLGGPFTDRYVFNVDWGESISASGRWLADAPNAETKTAVAGIAPSLAPFFPGQTLFPDLEAWPQADFVIVTANDGRTNPDDAKPDPDAELLHTIRYTGQDRAWIYAQPNPVRPSIPWEAAPDGLTYAGQVALLASAARADENHVHFYARWELPQPTDGRYTVKLLLKDTAGQIWQTQETALLNELYFYPEHWQPGETPEIEYRLPLPRAIPPGEYAVEMSLLAEASGELLPLLDGNGRIQSLTFTQPVTFAPPEMPITQIDIPVPADVSWLDGRLRLLGRDPLQPTLVNGGQMTLDLYWQAGGGLPDGLQLALRLGSEEQIVPLSQYDTGMWREGEIVHAKVTLAAPPEMPPGKAALAIRPLTADGRPLGAEVVLEEVEIIGMERLFELPPVEIPLAADFGGVAQLRGMDRLADTAVPGDTVPLTLYWQVDGRAPELVSVFVHVLNGQGEPVAQSDQWPGGLPSDIWAEGQIIVDEHAIPLPADLPPGEYRLAVGLYTPHNGQRLPATDAAGDPLPDNRLILPITLVVQP